MANIHQLSEQLLMAVKLQKDTAALEKGLASIELDELKNHLVSDSNIKAFWINVYNAYFQILRIRENKQKPKIYRDRLFAIAGQSFSLDDVEHGILRRFRYKYSLGYLANPFVKSLIKAIAVEKLDYRIHFALNCGAKSCPPIAFYSAENIEAQLELATQSFLEGETEVDYDKKEVHISTLFKWFLADFGGMKGIREVLHQHLAIDTEGYTLIFKPWDWEDDLGDWIS